MVMTSPGFYLEREVPITHDFWEPRPTAQKWHFGWDTAGANQRVVAPERVEVHYQILRQHGDFKLDLRWPNGDWWPYSRYYEWWAGGMAIAFGRAYTYVFLHVDPVLIYERWQTTGLEFKGTKLRKPGDYTGYVLPEINFVPIVVEKGEFVCWSGTSGYDDGPHLHMQMAIPGRTVDPVEKAVDPALVWPGIYERQCTVKHTKGET